MAKQSLKFWEKKGRKKIQNIDIHYSTKSNMLGPSNSLRLGKVSINDRVSLGERCVSVNTCSHLIPVTMS